MTQIFIPAIDITKCDHCGLEVIIEDDRSLATKEWSRLALSGLTPTIRLDLCPPCAAKTKQFLFSSVIKQPDTGLRQ